MNLALIVAFVLVLAVALASVRLILWQRQAETRAPAWRLATLLVLQPVCAGLIYLTLFPPPAAIEAGTLVVATRSARGIAMTAGDHVIALPEAPKSDAERLPDLATALRKYPDVARLRIVGEGLEARDREAVGGRALSFDAVPVPQGLVRLDLPEAVAPGTRFGVSGQVVSLSGTVELVDPAGQRVDAAPLQKSGEFTLTGTARTAGPAVFRLQVRDGQRRVLQDSEVPVWTSEDLAPRVLLLAGAPGPDVKYLRRWAEDAGIALHVQFTVGGGVDINDSPLPVTAATLRDLDLIILDERSWAGLGDGERAAVTEALRGGLGVLLRVTGPVSDTTRRQWAAFGLMVAPATGSLQLPPVAEIDTPDLTSVLKVDGVDVVPLTLDKTGKELGVWRLEGRGRVAIWSVTDAYGLVLSGQGERYGDIWSGVLTTLGRSRAGLLPRLEGSARQYQRAVVCGVADKTAVIAPDGGTASLRVDPVRGERSCAAVWPKQAGWHLVRQGDQPVWGFYVQPSEVLPGVRAAETREATQRLVSGGTKIRTFMSSSRHGASWPWFLAWLVVSVALWALERARRKAS